MAIGFALPVLGQEQESVDLEVRSADPESRQQIEAAIVKYEEAYDKYDAAALDLKRRPLLGRKKPLQQVISGSEIRYNAELPGSADAVVLLKRLD